MAFTIEFPGVALVTGAGGTGIGSGVAKSFAEAGCKRIAITDLNAKLLNDIQKKITAAHPDVDVFALDGDISSEEFVDRFVAAAVERFGRLDYSVNCAGVLGNNQPSAETSVKDFDFINNVNYRGSWLSSRAQIRAMLKQEPLPSHDPQRPGQRGSIVNIASQLGIVARPAAPAYCASKSAVIGMTRADAIDNSPHGIRVNCICPGLVETPMTMSENGGSFDVIRPAIDIAPMKRMAKVSEIADCALFLASSRSSFVQGSAMVVDGGYIIN